jgi:hypothetical protein
MLPQDGKVEIATWPCLLESLIPRCYEPMNLAVILAHI